MIFKANPYRFNYGHNFRVKYMSGVMKLAYKTRDNKVLVGNMFRRAGKIEFQKSEQIDASMLVPLTGGNVLSRRGQEIKSIKF